MQPIIIMVTICKVVGERPIRKSKSGLAEVPDDQNQVQARCLIRIGWQPKELVDIVKCTWVL